MSALPREKGAGPGSGPGKRVHFDNFEVIHERRAEN